MPLISCWMKTSMPARPYEAPPEISQYPAPVVYQGSGWPATAGPCVAAPCGKRGRGRREGGRNPSSGNALSRRDGRETRMGRYLLLWLLGVPIPILLLIWAFGGLN